MILTFGGVTDTVRWPRSEEVRAREPFEGEIQETEGGAYEQVPRREPIRQGKYVDRSIICDLLSHDLCRTWTTLLTRSD